MFFFHDTYFWTIVYQYETHTMNSDFLYLDNFVTQSTHDGIYIPKFRLHQIVSDCILISVTRTI